MNIPALQPSVRAADLPLEKLAGNSHVPEQEKVAEVSRQFEAVLLRQVLANAQKTHFASTVNTPSATSDIYRDMVTTQLADSISKSGALGLARTLSEQMSREAQGKERGTPMPRGGFGASGAASECRAPLRGKSAHVESANSTEPTPRRELKFKGGAEDLMQSRVEPAAASAKQNSGLRRHDAASASPRDRASALNHSSRRHSGVVPPQSKNLRPPDPTP